MSQEPKLLTQYAQDEKMLQTFAEGKDLYSAVAALVYNNRYEDNTEFDENGEFNLEGKQRRAACKSVILGLLYGRGVKSIAEQIKSHKGDVTKDDIKEANNLVQKFFDNYPQAKEWIDGTKHEVKMNEYVEDLWGRRRRLPEINLPKYEFKKLNAKSTQFTPLIGGELLDTEVDEDTKNKYIAMFKKAFSDEDRLKVEQLAYQEGIEAKDNGGLISKAERQSVNARIQGGAASMTKIAMVNLFNNERLKELDFHILIPVHDELICECPIENVEECKKLLEEVMAEAGKPECQVAMKCDADSFPAWYYDVMRAHFREDFEEMTKEKSKDEVFNILLKENSEFTEEQMKEFLGELY